MTKAKLIHHQSIPRLLFLKINSISKHFASITHQSSLPPSVRLSIYLSFPQKSTSQPANQPINHSPNPSITSSSHFRLSILLLLRRWHRRWHRRRHRHMSYHAPRTSPPSFQPGCRSYRKAHSVHTYMHPSILSLLCSALLSSAYAVFLFFKKEKRERNQHQVFPHSHWFLRLGARARASQIELGSIRLDSLFSSCYAAAAAAAAVAVSALPPSS